MALYLSTDNSVKCKLHPIVGLGIIDHYMRRPEGQDKVIGTLMGMRSPAGEIIEIRNCFPVPHSETDDSVAIDMVFHKTMVELHKRVCPDEAVVGWYATGSAITDHSLLIHDFFGGQSTGHPVLVTLDTQLGDGHMGIRAYTSSMLVLDGAALGTQFHPVEVIMQSTDAEKIGLDLMRRTLYEASGTVRVPSEAANLDRSMAVLGERLGAVTEYVDAVLAGRTAPNPALGRFLMEGLAAVPRMQADEYGRLFEAGLRDLLMVTYVADLIRSQLYLGERIDRVVTKFQRDSGQASYGTREGRGRGRGRGGRGGRGRRGGAAGAARERW